jgi:hypothetical protein
MKKKDLARKLRRRGRPQRRAANAKRQALVLLHQSLRTTSAQGLTQPEQCMSTGALCIKHLAKKDPIFVTKKNRRETRRVTAKGCLGQRATTSLATLNVRTLGDRWEPRLQELVNMCIKRRLLLLAVQEHRLHKPKGEIGPVYTLPLSGGWNFHYTACTDKGQGGVGLLLSPLAEKASDWIRPVTDRILSAQFSSQEGGSRLKTNVLCVYAPTSAPASAVASAEHLDVLSSAIGDVPLGHMLIVLGDMNATLQQGEGVLFTPPQPPNANASLLSDVLSEHDLIAVNTRFQKRHHRLVTFTGPQDRNVCLDYALCRSKWFNCFTDAYAFGAPIVSDHKVLAVSFKWRFSSKRVKPVVNYDVSVLGSNPKICDQFQESVLSSMASVHPTVASFSKAVADASAQHLPIRSRSKGFSARDDPDIIAARMSAAAARSSPTAHRQALHRVETIHVAKRLEWLQGVGREVDEASLNHKMGAAHKAIRKMTGQGAHRQGCKIPADGPQERLDLVRDGLAELFSPPDDAGNDEPQEEYEFMVDESVSISDEPFTIKELSTAANSLKGGKAADIGGLTAEVVKIPALAVIILTIITTLFEGGAVPEEILNSAMILLYKKGDPSNLGNYRGITIINLILKLYMKMVLNRMSCALDPFLRGTQNGFRRGRSTVQHVLALRRLIEETALSSSAELYILFVDFKKAFDTVKWSELWAILRAYRIPEKLIAAIRAVYVSSTAQARTADGLSGAFEFFAGVKQGCCLSPFLFIVIIDFVMRRATEGLDDLGVLVKARNGSRQPAEFVTDTGFADDISLLSTVPANLQKLTDRVVSEARRVGLMVNVPKTELMTIGAIPAEVTPTIQIYGAPVKPCSDFKFLGGWIRSSVKDFKVRRALAWKASMAMLEIWKCTTIPLETKRSLFRSTVEPILTHGAEAWTMTDALTKMLDGTYTRLLRHCLRVTYLDRWNNVKLYGELSLISHVLEHRRVAFVGHCARTDQPVAKLLFWEAIAGQETSRRTEDVVCRRPRVDNWSNASRAQESDRQRRDRQDSTEQTRVDAVRAKCEASL